MRYLKLCFSLFGIMFLAAVGYAANTPVTLSGCLAEGKVFFKNKEYQKASEKFTQCVKLNPSDIDAQLSLAGALLTQEKLNEAEEHFSAALKNMDRTSPYWSYTYSMLGDIALKQRKNDVALNMYSKSLAYNMANVNSLIGKGLIEQYQGNKKAAADLFNSALAVEPLNLIARKWLINLEPDYFSDEEILTALKQRYAVAPETRTLTEKDKDLFFHIHLAEQRSGVEYLKNKFPHLPQGYIVTLNKGSYFARDLLTLDGYQAMQKQLGQDAVNLFQNVGVPAKDLFRLRTTKGKPIFDANSYLTDEGFYAYLETFRGKKGYLLPEEEVAPSQAVLKKVEAAARRLHNDGYTEISFAELKMLEKETLCSRETLKDRMGVYFLPVTKKTYRFFVKTQDSEETKTIAYYYVMKNRAKKNPSITVPTNSVVESLRYFHGHNTVCLSDGNPFL